MRKSGYWSGPGYLVGTFTDTTTAARTYLREHGEQVAFIDLYEITLRTLGTVTTSTGEVAGLVLRHCAADIDVVFEGVLYAGGGLASGWKITQKGKKVAIGTGVEQLDLTVLTDGTDRLPPADGLGGTATFGLGEAIHGGIFEGAHCVHRCLLLPKLPTYPIVPTALDITLGATVEFIGQITEAKIKRSEITLPVKPYLEKLAQNIPRNVYQATCLNTLYDKMCGVSRTGSFGGNNFQQISTVAGWNPVTNIAALPGSTPQPDGFFNLGTLQITSGALCGMKFTIAEHTAASLTLLLAPPRPLEVGSSLVLQAGCDKVAILVDTADGKRYPGTCQTKFNNLANFRGFPHVPVPETAL